jgi:hypothetical protein
MIGNSVGTFWGTTWERIGNSMGTRLWTLGTLQELHGNTLGTLWEQSIMYSIFYFYRILNFITMLHYTLYKYNTLYYVIHTLYCTIPMYYIIPIYCIVPMYYTLQCGVDYAGQHSSSILSICLSLMGQSFPRWEQCWEHWNNIFYLNIAFGLQNVFQASTLLINVAISLKRC